MKSPPTLALVGGFLGAGKTTLVLAAAERLAARGVRVAFITNDQAPGLVDTALARAGALPTEEVSGGCFCCRLSDLVAATDALRAYDPDVIFAEPVGSCIDLSATIVHPLLADHPGRVRLAPLTVLVDPARARALRQPGADADLVYLFDHQIEEADIVCLTKADLGLVAPPLANRVALPLSARTGDGVDEWLSRLLDVDERSGRRALDIDYTRYARAEAALAWLNWQGRLDLAEPQSPLEVLGPLAERLDAQLTDAGAETVHVKLLDQTSAGSVRVSLCANGAEPTADGGLDASPTRVHHLLVNARVRTDPRTLAAAVEAALAPLTTRVTVVSGDAFAPPPPRPERRIVPGRP